VALVTSDAHQGLVAAIGATVPGASWQRCQTHYAATLMTITPKTGWPWVRTLLHSIYDQHDADSVIAQYDRVLNAMAEKLPKVAAHLETNRPDVLAFTAFPKEIWRQIWSNNPLSVNDSTERSVRLGRPPGYLPGASRQSSQSETTTRTDGYERLLERSPVDDPATGRAEAG
jgi:putative transposase